MKKLTFLLLTLSAIIGITACSSTSDKCAKNSEDYTKYVNPFIGTAYNGHVIPGPCMPFGMVQPSPETGNFKWRYCSGYNYDDKEIWYFGQTHLSGTGCQDLGDVAFIPYTGSADKKSFKSSFKKENEKAEVGLYKVYLDDAKADVKISSTNRVAIYEIKFDADGGSLLFDFQSGMTGNLKRRVISSDTKQISPFEITGAQYVRQWVRRNVYFYIVFDKPIKNIQIKKADPAFKADQYYVDFGLKKGETLKVKIALSGVGIDGAKANMKAELDGWDFDEVVAKNKAEWNKFLSKAEAKGDKDQLTNFYTSMYHAFIHPSNITDVDKKYRGADNKVYQSKNGDYYSTFSCWDTYRAEHPLFTIIAPEYVNDFVNTMLDHFDAQGHLPIWTLAGKENFCMIGNHSIPIIAEAILKGFDGFDAKRALNAMVVTSDKKLPKSDGMLLEKYGYYPFDIYKNESVSRTVEGCYDDYCVSLVAAKLGDKALSERFAKRSEFYKNLFDPQTKFMRGKDSKGNWRNPFNPFALSHDSSIGGDYTEGNAWQYSFHVQHEPEALIELFGGKDKFIERINMLFKAEDNGNVGGFVSDVTGLIGQYAHGNEPSHHVIYFYPYAGQKWRTQELVREVFDKFYLPKPDGLCGNDDCGQMSAWYLFSAMGFYPFNPASAEYVLGAPQLPEIVLPLANGNCFKIVAKNLSKDNKYVKSVKLNGKEHKGITIKHSDILAGGVLEFEMTDKPVK